jgi:hypothetical protein
LRLACQHIRLTVKLSDAPALAAVADGGEITYATRAEAKESYALQTYAKLFTTTSTSNTLAGVAVAVAANPSATGRVRLNGTFG